MKAFTLPLGESVCLAMPLPEKIGGMKIEMVQILERTNECWDWNSKEIVETNIQVIQMCQVQQRRI